MANLLATLFNSASALDAYDRVLEATQSNVANSSTPGYARQSLRMEALPFDPAHGLPGGVRAGEMQSSRDEYAELTVRSQTSQLGYEQQSATVLTALQAIFDISGDVGIPHALNRFYQSAAQWGQNPSSNASRQTVIERAIDVARTFQSSAIALQNLTRDTETQLTNTINQVNRLVGQIGQYNKVILQSLSGRRDMGVDAQIHADLESLSELIDFHAIKETDGTTTILLNGRVPLLQEDRQFALSSEMAMPTDPPPVNTQGAPWARLLASDKSDITAQTTDGQLGALLNLRNRVLPAFVGDAYQAGDLNRMAQQFADRVNDILTSGNISDGPPPVPGLPLFQYDAANPTIVARSLTVDASLRPDQLSLIDPGPPYVGNGVPLALARLSVPTADADRVDGISYGEFYGGMASRVGGWLQSAQNGAQVQRSLVAQAKNQRQELSGVDLNEEALILVEFQRAYQANSRIITVLDQLTQDTIDILR
ncbi:MAG TPA: flagellar hook-associated protein FlgK [Bryobacteraceae bacterium]|nr:flagellar hook-associated protein FlgK [Bryobacteraceae bacterium]